MNRALDFDLSKAIILAKNEIIIDSYEGFETINPVGKGYFTITNHRFLYFATSKDKLSSSISVTQWDINGIGGIKSEFGKRANILQVLIGYVLLIIGLVGLSYVAFRFFNSNLSFKKQLEFIIPSISVIILSILLIVFSKRKMFSLEVLTNSSSSTLVSFTSSFFRSPYKGKITIKPSNSTFSMIKEIGKSILDAQRFQNQGNRYVD